jgi:carnitine O-acetyltransferase
MITDGFFDAGMLLQALKAREEGLDDGPTKPSEAATVNARRREIGKKLRLSDY